MITRRRVGMFLLLMLGLAVIDWIIRLAFWGPEIIELVLYRQLYPFSYPPLPSGLLSVTCPGNGFAFFCGPWFFSLLIVFGLAVVVSLYVHVKRMVSLFSREGSIGPLDRHWFFVSFTILASAILLLAYIWGWIESFRIFEDVPLVTPAFQVVAYFIHYLFFIAAFTASRHLRRRPEILVS